MIYKDRYAHLDTSGQPESRGQPCLNCGNRLPDHYGWSCHRRSIKNCTFSQVQPHERYVTQSMLDSINSTRPQVPPSKIPVMRSGIPYDELVKMANVTIPDKENVDISDWRKWSHKVDGECACGIRREMCDYHRK